MGKPESLVGFEVFITEDVEIYIEKIILDKYVIDNEILMAIEGIGRFKLENIKD
ncbi:hypothetical protein [Anaerosolibacter sp.]|jgi:hypothetical protein|uniref:hypothetical protein n=1 Tax=Anaerosolibacter sp. TaxID=1872527 RepID=UPI002618FAC8|nr:hypothetical protein [Anaerosolibacter sp.]